MAAKFVHLHNHSHYSLLDGLSKIDEIVAKVKEYEMPAVALTDHGNLYGAIEFYKKCRAADIKPIIGVEAYIAARSRFDKEPNIDAKRYHLTLLAKDLTGYRNLIKLVTAANLEGYYYKPRLDHDLLRQHHQGIICLSGCMGSELGRALWARDLALAEKVIREHQAIFGPENYYLEISHQATIERQLEIKEATIRLARQFGIPLVATQDAHYPATTDARAHETLIGIQQGNGDGNRRSNINEDFSFASPAAMAVKFADTPEALENTLSIAARCEMELELGKWFFPNLKLPAGQTYDVELTSLAQACLNKYLAGQPHRHDEATKRLAYELDIICRKGYSPYFLVVSDILQYAHRQGIFTNTRGSAAGCFISYLIGITSVDPLEYKLPFERFLNADRPSPPDIDMDFADKRRDEVLDYVRHKYGEDKVAQIGTFGSMLARGSVRDVARALGHPYAVGDRISKLIPIGSQGFPMTIERALKETPELSAAYEQEAVVKEIIDLAQKIEGGARHISVHAAGVVISPTPLTDYVPVQYDPKGGKIITQYDMYSVEDVGLLKFDFLGIRNLSILEDSIRIVKKTQKREINIKTIPLDNQKTYDMLARGETIGLFQLNGAGMTRWLKELKPSTIHDINAMVALYRPGPMESIPEYIRRKHDPTTIKYLDPRMKTILDRSFGILTYQDDVMLVAIELAGYSWTEADKLRKAMGKKIPKEMEAQKEKLIKGLVTNGMTETKAKELWRLIEPFAAYGFNKAHAASYGWVAYQTAYMKANFPGEYMTACLTAESGDIEQVAIYVTECKRMNLPVLPPDVNESFGDFAVIKGQTDKIRFGLYTIKNLGTEIAEAIVSERKKNGPYQSFADFLDRVKHKNLNKKSLESLIKAGALDSLNEERGRLLANLDEALAYNRENSRAANQTSLFGLLTDQTSVPKLRLKEAAPALAQDKLTWEKELLGLYVSGHPLDKYKDKFATEEKTINYAKKQKENSLVLAAGLIDEAKLIVTKGGERMAFLRLTDFSGTIELVVFARLYNQYKDLLAPEKCIAVRGRLSLRNGEPSLVAEAIKEL